MLVRGKIIGESVRAPFEILKTEDGISLRVELPSEPFEYSTDCSCLEPLELLGLLLPAIEEEIGEIKGVFVEEVVEDRNPLLKRLRKILRGK
ncbi:hypothetical protein [Thermococcus aciditolerans]|uniref:Uncharacterized protein n=1 Tax=Thermococcus aciditolerans TaxID=2598455 RepID=A0A5C0SIN7_9EURY|nr:hypothetical protein [Thermococcus aciditolerans]QEK13862.1 hypothetical protein FPV09_00585 [Thermococcus aciditolerans]